MLNWFRKRGPQFRKRTQPALSVVVVVYNIPREAPRTLLSLSSVYQRHIDADDYEVIVVDNGSNPSFDHKVLEGLAGNFRLLKIDPAPASPAYAVNQGIAAARGEVVGVMIDGARITTPGLLHFARHGARLGDTAIVATIGWYLGYDIQRRSMHSGYDRDREDMLLASINWPQDGYRLFEISTPDESSTFNGLGPSNESNALFLRREHWQTLGGLDERFDDPGGGFVNLDILRRALELPDAKLVFLLGEGTFHQLHGGIATNAPNDRMERDLKRWEAQYEKIRGYPYAPLSAGTSATFIGTLPRSALAHFVRSAIAPGPKHPDPPLGRQFDRSLWCWAPPQLPRDPTIARLVELAQNEFQAGRYESAAGIAILARARAPDEPEPQRLLSLTAAWFPWNGAPQPWRVDYHLAMAAAHRLLGEHDMAISHFQMALALDPNTAAARHGIATLQAAGSAGTEPLIENR